MRSHSVDGLLSPCHLARGLQGFVGVTMGQIRRRSRFERNWDTDIAHLPAVRRYDVLQQLFVYRNFTRDIEGDA